MYNPISWDYILDYFILLACIIGAFCIRAICSPNVWLLWRMNKIDAFVQFGYTEHSVVWTWALRIERKGTEYAPN